MPDTAPNPQPTQNEHQQQQQTQIQQNTAPNPATNDAAMPSEQVEHEPTLDWFGNDENNPLNANHGHDEYMNNMAMFPMVCINAKFQILHFIHSFFCF